MHNFVIFSVLICFFGLYAVKRFNEPMPEPRPVTTASVEKKYTTPKAYRVHRTARRQDGHFYLDALVEGRKTTFLVDTGASNVILTAKDAARLGVLPPKQAYTHRFQTANGASYAAKMILKNVRIGPKDFVNVEAYVLPDELEVSLLGQSLLRQFKSVKIANETLELGW